MRSLQVMLCSTFLALLGAQADVQSGQLEEVLQRLDRVATLYRDKALKFTCRERITYYPGRPDPIVHDLEYIYVYDKANGLQDYRTDIPTGRKKDKLPREISPGELGLPTVVLRAYSAIFVFERSKKDMYRYSILGNERALGRDAVVIRFDAIPPYSKDYNDMFGRAWIDLETSQLLKVEALPADQHEEKQRLDADLAASSNGSDRPGGNYLIERISTELGIEHHGMRFPSRVVTRRSLFEVEQREGARTSVEHQIFWIEQTYSDYRFYAVRTFDQIRELVSGGTPPADRP